MKIKPGDPVWVGGFRQSPGSIGLQVFDRAGEFEGPLILTVGHAIGTLSRAGGERRAEAFAQPRELGGPSALHGQPIGKVVRSEPRVVNPRLERLEVDAALVELAPNVRFSSETPWGPLEREVFDFETEVNDPFADLPVYKVGATTGPTIGDLALTPEVDQIHLPSLGRRMTYQPVYYAIAREHGDFAAHGDSGAVVFDADRRPAAMVVGAAFTGSAPRIALCSPLTTVLAALQVHL